ncbi:hemolysin family protein [Pontiella sp.]|uniref:hemolysin family protein n=1 Tax=Pontiella sp. TaxID=2837462 RepID=UPI00356707B3
MITIVLLLGLFFLLCLSAFFSSSESALFSLDPLQVRRIGAKKPGAGRRIERLLSSPSQLLSAILIGNTLVNVAASSLGHSLIKHALPRYGIFIAVPTITLMLLVFGEVTPKRFALHMPERIAVLFAVPIDLFALLTKPLSGVFSAIDRMLHRGLGSTALTEDEFRVALVKGESGGLLKSEERNIMEGIIRLEGLSAADVMTPRIDLVGIDPDLPAPQIRAIARAAHFKFLPVYKESIDHIIGFLDVRNFLLHPEASVDDCIIAAPCIPETLPVDKLLMFFRKKKVRVVCVLDEFGGTAGIVTQGDVAEEIVADAELDIRETKVGAKPLDKNRWLVGGDTSINEMNDDLGTAIVPGNFTRVSGWLQDELDRIPRRGDVVETDRFRVIVRTVKQRRILSVVLELKPAKEERP